MAGTEVELQQHPITPAVKVSNRDRARRRWVTVEPVILLVYFGNVATGLIKPFYVKNWYRLTLYNTSSLDASSSCADNITDVVSNMEDEVQRQATLFLLYLSIASSPLVVISSMILGTLSDKLGRKMCMAIPICGYICQATMYAVTVSFRLPLPVLFVGEILQGLSGSFGLLLAGSMSYITDITSEKQRTIRIAVAEMIVFLSGGFFNVGVGYMLRSLSPAVPLGMAVGFDVLCLIYIAVPGVLIETVDRDNIPEHRKGLREAGRSIVKLLKFNENGRRWQMLLLDFLMFFLIMNIYGTLSMLILYCTAKPFCWDEVDAGLAAAFGFITASLGMVIGTKLFSFCVGEYWIMQISNLSILAFNVVVSVSRTTWLIYGANLLGALRGMSSPVVRSVLSKIVEPEEIGAAFSLFACVDNVAIFAATLMGPSIYAATVKFLPQTLFYVFAGVCVIPAGIILILQWFWPRSKTHASLHNEECDESGEEKEVQKDVPT